MGPIAAAVSYSILVQENDAQWSIAYWLGQLRDWDDRRSGPGTDARKATLQEARELLLAKTRVRLYGSHRAAVADDVAFEQRAK